jgi:hypothetical protein
MKGSMSSGGSSKMRTKLEKSVENVGSRPPAIRKTGRRGSKASVKRGKVDRHGGAIAVEVGVEVGVVAAVEEVEVVVETENAAESLV